MNDQWEKEECRNVQLRGARYTISQSYLVEAQLDKEWENNFRNEKCVQAAHLSLNHASPKQAEGKSE